MLTRHGVILKEINELTILKAFKMLSWKESQTKERLKRDQCSISPSGRDGSPRTKASDPITNYVKKLAPIAQERSKHYSKTRRSFGSKKDMQDYLESQNISRN